MCLIIIQRPGQSIPEDRLATIQKRNADGFGFMLAEGGRLIADKVLTGSSDSAVASIRDWYEANLAGRACVMHWRYATSGPKDRDHAHPFAIDAGLAVMHNGIVAGGSASESDTAQIVRCVLRPLLSGPEGRARLADPDVRTYLRSLVGNGSFVFLDEMGVTTTVGGSSGVEHDGCWYSNTYAWDYPRPTYVGYSSNRDTQERIARECDPLYTAARFTEWWSMRGTFIYREHQQPDLRAKWEAEDRTAGKTFPDGCDLRPVAATPTVPTPTVGKKKRARAARQEAFALVARDASRSADDVIRSSPTLLPPGCATPRTMAYAAEIARRAVDGTLVDDWAARYVAHWTVAERQAYRDACAVCRGPWSDEARQIMRALRLDEAGATAWACEG